MPYEPSRKKIEQECAAIRKAWTAKQERQRQTDKRDFRYNTPIVSLSDLPNMTQEWIESVNRIGYRSGE